jgi:CRP/FNR family nitrogen fixation transcriptional regulator
MQLATVRTYGVTRTPAASRPPNLMESLGTLRRYGADETVYCQGGAADYWYRIVDGAARQCTQISDGRRQIMDFLLPGDLFGFDASSRHECSVECVASNTTVARYQRQQIESLMESDQPLARRMREIAFGSIDRLQSRMILLGRSRALERVCGFLLELADRVQVEAEGTVALPMSRYDIADYLAIAVETVSRSLTTLRSERVITFFDARHFRIINRRALEAHCCR